MISMQSSPKNVGNLTHELDVNTALLRTAPFAERDVLFIENPIIEFRQWNAFREKGTDEKKR